MSDGPRALVVMPAFNEEGSVADVIAAVHAAGLPVCVIDDGSVDETGFRARAAGATVLRLPMNLGLGGALRCGFRFAIANGYDTVVQVDADGQHDPAHVVELLDVLRETNADMVIGSRFADGSGAYDVHGGRRLAMMLLARLAGKATGTYIADSTSGFRAIRRPLLDRFAMEYPAEYLESVEALIEAGRAGAKVVEHPVLMAQRTHGNPSAGRIASLWYMTRVLIAIELMHKRSRQAPLSEPRKHGWSD